MMLLLEHKGEGDEWRAGGGEFGEEVVGCAHANAATPLL